jgi:dihydroorotase
MPLKDRLMHVELLIQGGTCLLPGGELAVADIAMDQGRIVAIGALGYLKAATIIPAHGLTILPGVIDSQVHFREPGLEYKEDLESGTAGAALGGVTCVFEMPNTKPSTTTAEALQDKLDRAAGRAWTDYAFFIGAADENADQLGTLERLPGCCGVKVFMGSSTGSLLVQDDATLRRVLASGSRRVTVHAEDEPRLLERKALAADGNPATHPVWRDVETALRATTRLLRLARETGRRVHVLHVTTAEEAELLATHKDVATMEVLPQHLTLSAPECYDRLGTYAQMNPPIREQRHQEALWQAVRQGVVDVLASDHAPHTHDEKQRPYPHSPSGLTGVQTLLPVMLEHVHQGRLSLQRLSDLVTAGPARVFGVTNKGRIARGYDGDLTVVDLKARRTITHRWIRSKVGWTPFDGMAVTGWPVMTIVRGQLVMREDELLGQPVGQPVRFQETRQGEG